MKNIDQQIILTVQNLLGLDSSILPQCDKCFEAIDLYSTPHKIKMIALISRTYLNIRLNAYSKILTSSIMKAAVSKRQKLNKTILFNNM